MNADEQETFALMVTWFHAATELHGPATGGVFLKVIRAMLEHRVDEDVFGEVIEPLFRHGDCGPAREFLASLPGGP
ncbi:hypothetical protein [Actinomadura rupiterrae]|uniref:hypothetical protein n=1 Tax=Actinomadura rupiterrae TaxID=559627 RepID=UPI0020A612FC|nr:hypothetical protein [Actinomadura rupiterrae]MCP2342489.1 hypothetical protein [Actinomadura rupiterrae]